MRDLCVVTSGGKQMIVDLTKTKFERAVLFFDSKTIYGHPIKRASQKDIDDIMEQLRVTANDPNLTIHTAIHWFL